MNKPRDVIDIFDNGGKTIDRYTIITPYKDNNYNEMLALGDDVTSPQGFSQFSCGNYEKNGDNSHLGKRIKWEDLSETHQKHIIMRLHAE